MTKIWRRILQSEVGGNLELELLPPKGLRMKRRRRERELRQNQLPGEILEELVSLKVNMKHIRPNLGEIQGSPK